MTSNETDISDRVLTPRKMGYLADQLEEAIKAMRGWRIRIPENNSRLPKIVRVLRGVPPRDAFPESRTRLTEIAHAVRDAQEFAEISWVLPKERLEPVHESLRKAVFGVLGQTPHKAYQSQSELWVGAVLTRSGAFTGVITNADGKRPDFVLRNGTMKYSVEVKRPESSRSLRDHVSGAAKQLRRSDYHGGSLVVDLTDCLDSELTLRFGTGAPDMEGVKVEFKKLTDTLRKKVFDDRSERIEAPFRHILNVIAFTRATWWDVDDLSQMHSLRYVLPIVFLSRGGNTLRNRRARWLAKLIDKGIGRTGHQDLGKREVTFD